MNFLQCPFPNVLSIDGASYPVDRDAIAEMNKNSYETQLILMLSGMIFRTFILNSYSGLVFMHMNLAQHCVHQLKILADTTRFSVLTLLIDGPSHVHELNAVLDLEQSLLSHHLKVLRENGFVISERDGKAVRYRLANSLTSPVDGALNLGCCTLAFEPNDVVSAD